jgi:hypothetical protein
MISMGRLRRVARILGAIGVLITVIRGFTRITRNPSMRSSEGRDGSCCDVTTVTSWPRDASSRDKERT